MPPNVNEILGQQGRRLEGLIKLVGDLKSNVDILRQKADRDARTIRMLKEGVSFREAVKSVAELVIPFHYILPIPITAAVNRFPQNLQISPAGWFFADRIWGSFRPTAGANAGIYQPIAGSDPTIATAAALPADLLNFDWEYREADAGRARQSDSNTIPGDVLYRHDSDGYLLGGDPWCPQTSIGFAITTLVAPANAGVFIFTILGEQCINTREDALTKWIERRRELGLI